MLLTAIHVCCHGLWHTREDMFFTHSSGRDFQIQSTSRSEMPNDCIVSKYPQQAHERCLPMKGILLFLSVKEEIMFFSATVL